MLPKFLQNLLNKKKFLFAFLILIQFSSLGFVDELDKLLRAEKNRFFEKINFITFTPNVREDIARSQYIKIDEDFLISTLLRVSPQNEKFLFSNSTCSLYNYLISPFAQDAIGEIKNIPIHYLKEEETKLTLLPVRDFFELVVIKSCPQIHAYKDLLNDASFLKEVKNITNLIPDKKENCEDDFSKLLENPQTLNTCFIYQELASKTPTTNKIPSLLLKKLRKNITEQDSFFLQNLCLSDKKTSQFCKEIFDQSYWKKIFQGKASPSDAIPFCPQERKKLKKCLQELGDDSNLCHYPKGFEGSLLPLQSCEHLSLANNYSRLQREYPECPLNIENMGVVASSRLISHINETKHPINNSACLSFPLSQFADFNLTLGNPLAWDFQLCYLDKIENQDKCAPAIMGHLDNSPYSQDLVITQILRKLSIISNKQECLLIDKKEYNPLLLKYKTGCYIFSQDDECSLSKCSLSIIYNEKEIKDIFIKHNQLFDYFSYDGQNRNFSQINLITEQLKKHSREIRNLSTLRTFFKKNSKGILNGIGCAEILYPSFFSMKSLYQCSPLPFIIDGTTSPENEPLLIIRSAIDSLQTPRLTPWARVFSAVKLFQMKHPQKQWSLNGIY